jgi:hypothetical protein
VCLREPSALAAIALGGTPANAYGRSDNSSRNPAGYRTASLADRPDRDPEGATADTDPDRTVNANDRWPREAVIDEGVELANGRGREVGRLHTCRSARKIVRQLPLEAEQRAAERVLGISRRMPALSANVPNSRS